MKFFSEFGLREGSHAEYIKRHDEIWPEMVDLIQEAGLNNYSIWNTGNKLYEYYECDQPQRAHRILRDSAVKQRWDDSMKDILVMPDPGKFISLQCVFDLEQVIKGRTNHD